MLPGPNVTPFAVQPGPGRDPPRDSKGTRTFILTKGTTKGTRTFISPRIAEQSGQRMGRQPPSLTPMPRFRRIITPGLPYHVTQRGNYRERVFLSPGDPEAYLSLLHAYTKRFGLLLFAYCLMPNHVHLIILPTTRDGPHRALRAVHCQYAQRIHRMRAVSGHLWQGRYRACALDSVHFVNAVRYTELNPVRAGLVARAEDYPWSSAAAHCGRRADPLLEPAESSSLLKGITDWRGWLAQGVPEDCLNTLRRHAPRDLPCGSDEFVTRLEESAGRCLRYRPRGGQKKS